MFAEVKKLLQSLDKGKKYILLLLLRAPFDFCMAYVYAYFLESGFMSIQNGKVRDLNLACGIFMIASFFLFLYNGIVWSVYATFVTKIEGKLRVIVFDSITKLSMRQIDQKSKGDWFTRLNTDIQMAINMLSGPLTIPHAVVSFANIVICTLVLGYMSLPILGVSALFIIPHILVSQIVVAKPMTELKKQSQEDMSLVTTHMQTMITNADIILLYDAQELVLEKFQESSIRLKRANMKMHIRNAIGSGLLPLFGWSGYLMLFVLGGPLISSGVMTFGELTAISQYRGSLLKGTMMLVNSMIQMKIQLAGVLRVNETCEMYELGGKNC